MSVIAVKLTKHEIYMGAIAGVGRMMKSLDSPKKNQVNNKDFGWHTDIEGSCGEVAFAKAMGMYWDGSIDTFKAPDVGKYQVRHTPVATNSLIVRPGDSNAEVYVLVTGDSPNYVIRGWMWGKDAKVDAFHRPGFNNMPPAWFVPQDALNLMNTLP